MYLWPYCVLNPSYSPCTAAWSMYYGVPQTQHYNAMQLSLVVLLTIFCICSYTSTLSMSSPQSYIHIVFVLWALYEYLSHHTHIIQQTHPFLDAYQHQQERCVNTYTGHAASLGHDYHCLKLACTLLIGKAPTQNQRTSRHKQFCGVFFYIVYDTTKILESLPECKGS